MKSLIYSLPFDTEEDFIAHIVEVAAAAWHLSVHNNLLHCCQLCIEVSGHTLEHQLKIGKNNNFFSEYVTGFA